MSSLWYKDAVIYQLHVRAFGDSNGDGIGDFSGLISHLDHLQNLGATAVWLLPFYPSPLRDDGYDIADYGSINPSYGTMRDFKRFLKAAHNRGLRVVTEMVLNHTSDQHPWFQRARKAPPGSSARDFYVWTDDPEKWSEARIIFEDTEVSNWTWDPVAGAYYWHRFFHHQPDLNYDNPDVQEAMFQAVDKWFEMGVDGLRLDAVPYLFERDGTNCENLPETHDFLKKLRAHVDAKFDDRMLLAEANQWPEDAVAYFGDGDEAHTAFHFPLMPRMFMALRMEDRHPIIDILRETPEIPESCQWMTFLRNHDELTLEMVTDEERDYMYRSYATDPQMRINVGIRRRLAPLLQNDRRKIELMYALLFALPGTPVIYYGEEIGMGDNVYLGDRDAVRTPMQWSPDRNAGFSVANPHSLYLPTIIDSEYHFESVNVEAQNANPSSILWWLRRRIALRHQHPVFGRGQIEFLYPENAKVLAFLRFSEEETVLVVANLSRNPQQVELDLNEHLGRVPVEMFGGTPFAPIAESRYPLTLGPYDCFWFQLADTDVGHPRGTASSPEIPTLTVRDDWTELLAGRPRRRLLDALPRYLARTRWFSGKARAIRSVELVDSVPLRKGRGKPSAALMLVRIEYAEGDPDVYSVPLTVIHGPEAQQFAETQRAACIAWLEGPAQDTLLIDAATDPSFGELLFDLIDRRRRVKSTGGSELRGAAPGRKRFVRTDTGEPRPSGAEQSNTSIFYGDDYVLKMFRRVQEGVNPELELGTHLSDVADFENVAPLVGSIQLGGARGEPRTLAVLNHYVPNEGDMWRHVLDALGRWIEELAAGDADAHGPILTDAETLGNRTAELHLALAEGTGETLAPEPFTKLYQRSLYQSMKGEIRPVLRRLHNRIDHLDEEVAARARPLLDATDDLVAHFEPVRQRRIDAQRLRIHGDYHLGQVLKTGSDVVIVDFEGEPSRPPSERRIKRSPLRDVAGMIRSFDYVAHAALQNWREREIATDIDVTELERAIVGWRDRAIERFRTGYFERAADAGFLPDVEDIDVLLDAYLLEKAIYELGYELDNRPAWVSIPLDGLLELLAKPLPEQP